MTDLTTRYLGLTLKNPIVASSSPLTERLDAVRQMEDSGVAAIVLPSLFEEQLNLDSQHLHHGLSQGAESFAEALNYFPDMDHYNLGPERYLEHIKATKAAVDIPVIASLNGVTPSGWTHFAERIQVAGADALELNVYDLPVDPERTGFEVESEYETLVAMIRETVTIPVAVKLSPFFSAIPNMAKRLAAAGADALVLFNRFYQPDLDIEALEIQSSLTLSHSTELLLRLRWIAILHGVIEADLAVTGGVHTAEDVIKSIMAGAAVTMMTSAILNRGTEWPGGVLDGVRTWMEEHEYQDLDLMRGCLSRRNAEGGGSFERANYMKVLSTYRG
jgi:dihydroorotate dehydrogenase (fumarate)